MHILAPLCALFTLAAASPASGSSAAAAPPKWHTCDPNAPSPYFYIKRTNKNLPQQRFIRTDCSDCSGVDTHGLVYNQTGGRFFAYYDCSLRLLSNPIDGTALVEDDGRVTVHGFYTTNPNPTPEKTIVCNSGQTLNGTTPLECFYNRNKKLLSWYHCGTQKQVYAFTGTPPASLKCVKQNVYGNTNMA